jgi:6-phosphogluconolactonase
MRQDRRFDSPDAMAAALAEAIALELSQAIASRGHASLVVSGGRTPVLMFDRLSRERLSWNKVQVTLADERLVPATDADANERLVRDRLLQNEAERAVFLPLWQGEGDPVESALEAISAMNRPFDVVVLGLGEDGHFASLFPRMPGLTAALDPASGSLAIFVENASARRPRVSLTLAALLDARLIILSFAGMEKREVLERALRPGPLEDLPIRAVLRQNAVPVDVYWSAV